MKFNLHFRSYFANFFLERKCFERALQRISKHTFCVQWRFIWNRTVYEIMWKNIVERGRRQTIIWFRRIACRITMATHMLTICNTYWFSTSAMVARTRFIVTFICTLPVLLFHTCQMSPKENSCGIHVSTCFGRTRVISAKA